MAHVTLPPGGATAGDRYAAAFRVGHACNGARSTTGITVRIPEGFTVQKAEPRPGWTLATSPGSVSWRADSARPALPAAERAEFVVRGTLTTEAGHALVQGPADLRQSAASDWAEVPATAADKPAFPAARLDVLAARRGRGRRARRLGPLRGQRPERHRRLHDAWSRPRGPPVGVATPVAGNAEVHEMKMDGDVMRMREVNGGLDLPPRQAVELKPGGYHLMLTDLKQPLVVGETVPLTLEFVDRDGRKSVARLQVPVRAAAAAAATRRLGAHRH